MNERNAEDSISDSLERALNEIDRAMKIAKKNLPEGKRLSNGLSDILSSIKEEIMFIQKGEYS